MFLRRLPQLVLIANTALLAWLLMQVVHECGHALFGWLTGGEVRRMVLHPLTISRTDLDGNPHPMVVCWAGPVIGSIAPVMFWLIARATKWSGEFWLRFFAGFCLIANGSYLAVGSFDRIGDAGDLLKHGSPIWMLWLFGAATISVGLRIWHRLGASFGLGAQTTPVRWPAALVVTSALLVTVTVETLLSGR
jgi:peptidase M50B-like protein